MFVILSNWGTYAISFDPEMVNLLARVCVIFHSLPRGHWLEFSRAMVGALFVIWPNYGTYVISCDSVTASFLARSRVLANSLALWGAHRLQFFASDRFQYSSFCPIGVPMRFHPIPRRSIF